MTPYDDDTSVRSRMGRAGFAVSALTTVALVAGWFVLFRPTTLGGPAGFIIVSGHSMEPTFVSGDLAITQRQSRYARGDIVAFAVDGGVVIHRIVGGDAEAGYEVQGDNKARPDLWRPLPDQIVGRVWLTVPSAGVVLATLRQPAILAALSAAVVFLVAFSTAPNSASSSASETRHPGTIMPAIRRRWSPR